MYNQSPSYINGEMPVLSIKQYGRKTENQTASKQKLLVYRIQSKIVCEIHIKKKFLFENKPEQGNRCYSLVSYPG